MKKKEFLREMNIKEWKTKIGKKNIESLTKWTKSDLYSSKILEFFKKN